MLSDNIHFVGAAPVAGTQAGLPIADFAVGGTKSDIVCMKEYHELIFLEYWGAQTGGTCTHTLTVVPCDTAAATTTTTAIPFRYKKISAGDTNGAWTAASSVVTTAGANGAMAIHVKSDDLPLVTGVKYEYCYLNIAETTDDPALGGVIIMMLNPRYKEATTDTVCA